MSNADRQRLSPTGRLRDVLDTMRRLATGASVSLGDIWSNIGNRRIFGAMIIICALMMSLPIPVWPVIFATLTGLLGVQLLIGRERPWFPQRLMRWQIPTDKLLRVLDQATGPVAWIDRNTARRLEGMTGPMGSKLVAVAVILLSVMMAPISLLPIIDFAFITGFMLLGAALLLRDGVMALAGIVVTGALLAALPLLIGSVYAIVSGWF